MKQTQKKESSVIEKENIKDTHEKKIYQLKNNKLTKHYTSEWYVFKIMLDIYLLISTNLMHYFIISLFQAFTCFEHMCLSSGGQKLYYTVSDIITPIGGCPVHRLREDWMECILSSPLLICARDSHL